MEETSLDLQGFRLRLESDFSKSEKEFLSTALSFYQQLGFEKYYAKGNEESITVKSAAVGAEFVKIKVDTIAQVAEKKNNALEFSKIFKDFPLKSRIELAEDIAREVENHAQSFALIFATDTGKPVQLGISEINGKGAQWAKWAGGRDVLECLRPVLKHKNAERRVASASFHANDIVSLTTRVPSGDVAAIGGYNYLYALVINKFMQSLVAGNGTMIKVSQHGAHWAFLLVDKVIPTAINVFLNRHNRPDLDEVIKKGLCQVVSGRREEDPFMQAAFLAFTGSDSGAEGIAPQRGVRRSTFERGGNSPVIICPSFLENKSEGNCRKLASDLVAGLNNSGQRCTAPRQIYLLKGIEKTEFTKNLNEQLQAISANHDYVGNPYSFATRNGPIVDVKAVGEMQKLIALAKHENCVTVAGERVLASLHPGSNYFQPGAIYWNSASDEPIYREEMKYEVFAPLLQIVQNLTLEQAVEFSNYSPQQLAGAVFSADEDEINYVRSNIKTGSLQVNSMPADPSPLAPHVDDTGHGDGGDDSLSKYTRQQVIEGPYHLIKQYADKAFFIFNGK